MGGVRGSTTITRLALALALLVTSWAACAADDTDPYGLHVVRAVNGRAMALPDGRLLVLTPRPAWSTRAASLAIASRTTDSVYATQSAADIRTAAAWNGKILAVNVDSGVTKLMLMDMALHVEQYVQLDVDLLDRRDVHMDILVDSRLPYALLRIADMVWSVSQPLNAKLLDHGVRGLGVGAIRAPFRPFAAMVTDVGSVAYLTVLDSTLQRTMSPSVPLAPEATVASAAGQIVVCTPIDEGNGVQVTIVDPVTSASRYLTLDVATMLVCPLDIDTTVSLALVALRNGRHELIVTSTEQASGPLPPGTLLPGDLGQPLRVLAMADTIVVVFSGGIVTALSDGSLLSKDALGLHIDAATARVQMDGQGMILASNKGSTVIEMHTHPLWWLWSSIDTIAIYVVPIVLAVAFGIVVLLLRRQRRFVNAMIDLPAAGIVFLLDANGRLLRTNERGMALLRITKNVPMRRQFRSYMLHDGVQPMLEFITIVTSSRVSLAEKMSIVEAGAHRELVCTSIPLRGTLGRNRGSLVTCVDITEALERRRLVNWAQLAHDMQTNLSTIRLNAELLEDSDQRSRILFQASVLIQRVRDLVSVGRSEELNRSVVHSAELCTELRHEFDPALFPHVGFSMKLRGTMMSVDRLKVSRAVRNAIENAIKALRGKPGTVEIATWFDRSSVYIRISDSGVGMEPEVLENMMKPYFTTANDGTGTGIGTMIMQHVVQQHGGSIRVTSEPGVGTQIVFRLPHGMEGPRLRNARWAVESEAV